VIRASDSKDLEGAMRQSMNEGLARGRVFGAIAVSADGAVVYGKTSQILLAAYATPAGVRDTLDLDAQACTVRALDV